MVKRTKKAKVSGIYAIICTVNNKARIGHADDMDKRWSQYKSELKHDKLKCKKLQDDYNLYGIENFSYKLLETCPQYLMKELENKYIDEYHAISNGYNKNYNNLNNKKKVRRGKEAHNFSIDRSEITSGSKNGHCTKLSEKKVFDILDMIEQGTDYKIIADKYNINPSYLSRIGKDRWVKAYEEWFERKETACIFGDTQTVSININNVVNIPVGADILTIAI